MSKAAVGIPESHVLTFDVNGRTLNTAFTMFL